jgi:hypothetical protein
LLLVAPWDVKNQMAKEMEATNARQTPMSTPGFGPAGPFDFPVLFLGDRLLDISTTGIITFLSQCGRLKHPDNLPLVYLRAVRSGYIQRSFLEKSSPEPRQSGAIDVRSVKALQYVAVVKNSRT